MQRKISAESPSPGFAEKLVEGITRPRNAPCGSGRARVCGKAPCGNGRYGHRRYGHRLQPNCPKRGREGARAKTRSQLQSSVRRPTQKKEALEYGAGQHYVNGVPRCGLSSTADVHTEEAWCRIRRSPDHSLAGVFYFPDVTFVLVQLPGGSHGRHAIFLHSAKASGHARDIFHASATPIVL